MQAGDQIIEVGGEEIGDSGDLWRSVWSHGIAGASVPLRVVRDDQIIDITVQSADRTSFLKAPKLH